MAFVDLLEEPVAFWKKCTSWMGKIEIKLGV